MSLNSAELPNGLLGELRDTLIDNFGAEDTKGVMRIIKAILLKYWPKNAQQPEDALQYGDKIEQKRGDEWMEIGTFARYGQAGQIIGVVDIAGMLAEVTCDPPIRKKPESEDFKPAFMRWAQSLPVNEPAPISVAFKAGWEARERRAKQALHPALPQLYERYDLAMKRVRESGLDKRPYWSGEATGLEIAINLLGGTTDDR